MKRVLVTGMSGTGKTAVIAELQRRGHRAVDLDTPEWSHWVATDPSDDLTPDAGRDWLWREDRVRALLSAPFDDTLFISGCAENMHRLYPLIDHIILLSAPAATIMARLGERSAEAYGHSNEERERVAQLMATIEPLLREAADDEIDTRQPVAATVDEILRITSR